MRSRLLGWIAVCACCLGSSAVPAVGQCFGNVQGASDDLATLNLATGVVTTIPDAATIPGFMAAYAYDPFTDTLFGAQGGGGTGTGTGIVFSVNRVTGAHTDLGAVGGSLLPGTVAIGDMAVRPSDGTLFGVYIPSTGAAPPVRGTTPSIGTIGKINGIATLVGATGTPAASGCALEFDAAGTLFYADNTGLYTINQVTGAATFVAALSFTGFPAAVGTRRPFGMGRDAAGVMHIGIRDGGPTSRIATLNTATGACTFVALITSAFYHGFGIIIPLPPVPGAGPPGEDPDPHRRSRLKGCFVEAATAHAPLWPLLVPALVLARVVARRRLLRRGRW